jgi:hypothetical protein
MSAKLWAENHGIGRFKRKKLRPYELAMILGMFGGFGGFNERD